jgi:hypothetical protein
MYFGYCSSREQTGPEVGGNRGGGGAGRGHQPERRLAQPRRILFLEALHLPRLPV